jgi:hypothetical protein
MTRYRSGYVRVDISDVLHEIEDDCLLEELKQRKLTPAAPGETVDLDIVREAYDAIGRNRTVEARVILERLLFPKWKTKAAAQSAYDQREKLAF